MATEQVTDYVLYQQTRRSQEVHLSLTFTVTSESVVAWKVHDTFFLIMIHIWKWYLHLSKSLSLSLPPSHVL